MSQTLNMIELICGCDSYTKYIDPNVGKFGICPRCQHKFVQKLKTITIFVMQPNRKTTVLAIPNDTLVKNIVKMCVPFEIINFDDILVIHAGNILPMNTHLNEYLIFNESSLLILGKLRGD